MIRPIAPTHKESAIKAERIKQAQDSLRAAELHTLKENLAFGGFVLIAICGALLLGKLISVIVREMV